MKYLKISGLLLQLCLFAATKQNIFSQKLDYKAEMRKLILEIREQAGKDKIIITQNGLDVYFNDKGLDRNFLNAVNGAAQEDLLYGYNGFNKKTPHLDKERLFKKLENIKNEKISIFSVNYAENRRRQEIASELSKLGISGEVIPSLAANSIYTPIRERNYGDVTKLEDVKNFLYILNPEKFSGRDSYFEALDKTNFDMLIIEPSVNGRFLSKEQIEKLKYRSDGTRRLVIAYFSIGEAEDYRYYWQKGWKTGNPSWLVQENKNWKGNFIVEYWNPQWKKVVGNYQKILDSIGVDGYFLDTLDTYMYFMYK